MFWFHLARTVFHCSVADAMSRCSKKEFDHWQALYRLRPWGDDWQQAATVAWWAGNSGRMKKSTKVGDLIPAAKNRRWITDPAKFERVFRTAFGGGGG